jgi:serine/threonine protein kinase
MNATHDRWDPGSVFSVPGYDVAELIGFGATGEVWLGREHLTGDLVALKRLRRAADRPARDRMLREAALLTELEHPHLVRMRAAVPLNDEFVLVLDHAAGGSLEQFVAARGSLGAGEVVTLAVPLAEALEALHRRGVVHGDVTPANILLDAVGKPLLADLGIAWIFGEQADAVEGRLPYVDPVVLAGGSPTPAADVYALAAVCSRALTGEPPGAGASSEPDPLQATILRAMDPDPARRPTAGEFAVAAFAAAPAVPLRLPALGQAASPLPPRADDVTHRVRAARASASERLESVQRRRPALVRRLAGSGRRPAVGARRAAPGARGTARGAAPGAALGLRGTAPDARGREPGARRTSRPHRPSWLTWRVGAAAAATVAGLGLATLVGVAWAGLGSPEPASLPTEGPAGSVESRASEAQIQPREPTAGSDQAGPDEAAPDEAGPDEAGPDGTAEAAAPDDREDSAADSAADVLAATALDADWPAVLAELDERRAQAFATGDPTVLASVYAAAAPALARDEALVEELVSADLRTEGLELSTLDVGVIEPGVGDARPEGSVVLEVVDEMSPYVLVEADTGDLVESRPGRDERAWRVTLVEADGEWQVWDVLAAEA